VGMGKRIAKLRQERGLTREVLAKEAGISAAYIKKIELGYINPHIKTISRLAEILEVELGVIFNGSK
jgi:transcriptional regulator with XRE-family HTH domain